MLPASLRNREKRYGKKEKIEHTEPLIREVDVRGLPEEQRNCRGRKKEAAEWEREVLVFFRSESLSEKRRERKKDAYYRKEESRLGRKGEART